MILVSDPADISARHDRVPWLFDRKTPQLTRMKMGRCSEWGGEGKKCLFQNISDNAGIWFWQGVCEHCLHCWCRCSAKMAQKRKSLIFQVEVEELTGMNDGLLLSGNRELKCLWITQEREN